MVLYDNGFNLRKINFEPTIKLNHNIFMDISLGKFISRNCGHTHQTDFKFKSFSTLKVSRVTAPVVSCLT